VLLLLLLLMPFFSSTAVTLKKKTLGVTGKEFHKVLPPPRILKP
jgi:hypothetical protein